jgi:PKD repeat protein
MYSNQFLRGLLLFIFIYCYNSNIHAQLQSTYTIGLEHEHYSILESSTAQGHYVLAGTLESGGSTEIHALEIDALGNPIWERTYSISGKDQAFHIQAAPQGYLIVGVTDTGVEEAFAMSIDPAGNYLSSTTYPDMQFGSGSRFLHSSAVLNDPVGGFIAAGWLGGANEQAQKEAWIVRLDPNLNVMWSRTFDSGGNNNDFDMASNVIEADGKGFFVSGSANASGGDQVALAALVDYSNGVSWSTAYADNNGNGHNSVAGSAYYDPVLEEVFQLTNLSIIHHFGVNVFDILTGVRNNFESWAIFSQFGYANIQGFRVMESLNSSNLVIAGYMRDHLWPELDASGNTTGVSLTGSVPFMMEIPKHPGAIIAGGANPVIWDQLYEVPTTNLTLTSEIYDLFSAAQQPRIYHPEMAFRQADGSGYALNAYRSLPGSPVNELELIETSASGQNNCTSDELGFLDTPRAWFDYPVGSQSISQSSSGYNFIQSTIGSQPMPCNAVVNEPCELQLSIEVQQVSCDLFHLEAQNFGAPIGADICLEWGFGDGTTSTNSMETHTFPGNGTHVICLTMWCCDDPNNTVTQCVDLVIDCCEAPVPDVQWSCENGQIVVAATNNGAPADPDLYCWIWEDGTTGGDYTMAIGDCDGLYGVCLEMYCCNDSNSAIGVCVDFTIDCCGPCEPLTPSEIDFTWGTAFSPNCPQGCSIGFGCPTLDPDKYCVLWEFGDGTTYDIANSCPIHCYTCSGVYDVCLTVFCCEDPTQSTTVCHEVDVDCCTLPAESDVDFVLNSIDGCTVSVDLILPDITCSNDLCWSWNMGDGTLITGTSGFTHTYAGSGIYTICLDVHCCNNLLVGYTICQDVQIDCPTDCEPLTPNDIAWDWIPTTLDICPDACEIGFNCPILDPDKYCVLWEFGDGETYTDVNLCPIHCYTCSGIYDVCLTVYCCDDPTISTTLCQEVVVECCNVPTDVDFNLFNGQEPCNARGDIILPDTTCPDDLCWSWDFGDGNTQSGGNFFDHTYTASDVYTVCLNVFCCTDPSIGYTVCKDIEIDCGCQLPSSIFIDQLLIDECTVELQAGYTDDYTGPLCFEWDMGDGSTASGESILYSYAASGTYTVCLSVFCCDSPNEVSTICTEVTVECGCDSLPDFEWEYFPSTNGIDCQQGFCITTPIDASIYCATWDFGDGTVENHPIDFCPVHDYLCDGIYDVCVTVYCCEDPNVALTVCNAITVNCPCSVPTGIDWIYSLTPDCEAQFETLFPITQCPENYCYTWDFGDGTTQTGTANPFHAFPGNGVYTVCLTVYCCDVATDVTSVFTICHDVTIDCGCQDLPSFEWEYFPSTNGIDCQQGFCITTPIDASIYCATWDFGDGTVENHPIDFCPVHDYLCDGIYDVCVTVYCCQDPNVALTVCNAITVNCPCSVPTGIDWIYSLTPDCEAQFETLFPITQCPENYCYTWDFGDGTTQTGTANPFHAFPGNGVYTVCLTVYCCDVATDATSVFTICHDVTIDCGDFCPKPCELNPMFIMQEIDDCTYLFNNFTVPGMYTNVSSYFWDFGDGGTSTSTNPMHTFPASGTYTVCLTVTGYSPEGQCEQTFCWDVVADCFCATDVNQDGVVSIADLLMMLGSFGSSCN